MIWIIRTFLNTFLKDKTGVTAIEYGLIAAGIGVAIIAGVAAIGTDLDTLFEGVADKLVIPE